MTPTERLLPCPFCGASAEPPSYSHSRWACRCSVCGAGGQSFWQGGPNPTEPQVSEAKAEAVAAWNRRSALEPTTDAGEGWVLVPREPTPEMCMAYIESCIRLNRTDTIAIAPGYRAMLAAAPTPTTEPTEDREETGRG
jgi:Lar family restriction alleviation protein